MTANPVQLEAERLRRVIARRVAGIVNIKGIDRAALAAAVGTSETRISRVMKESSDLSAVELALVARYLGVKVGVLTGDENPDPATIRRK